MNISELVIILISLFSHPYRTSANFEQPKCPNNFSGPDCTIPYQRCPDGKRRCFNNSICIRNNKKDPIDQEYAYSCDCSFASQVSPYAGHECEHSATAICHEAQHGSTFCTNGGVCGTYVMKAQVHTGCHCPIDFAGAHCQYLKATIDEESLVGEGLIEEVGENFFGFVPQKRDHSTATGIAIGIGVSVLVAVGVAISKGMKKEQRISFSQLQQFIHSPGPSMDSMDDDLKMEESCSLNDSNKKVHKSGTSKIEII